MKIKFKLIFLFVIFSVISCYNDIFLKGGKLDDREQIVHFKNKPKEWYLIIFDIEPPCWIEYIYNPQLSHAVIGKRELLGGVQINRIEMRFRNEILKPAEQYGKMHHVPDYYLSK